MADGSVEFEIRADNSAVSETINDTTNKLKSAAGQWEGATQGAANSSSMFSGVLQGVGQMLGGVVAGMAQKAAQALKAFAVDCINAASDLAEVQNVVDTVFGSDAKEIYSWAKQAQSAFGLAETAALRYTSTLGALLKSSGLGMDEVKEMSTTIAGLAADMASFYNLDFDTAFEKLKSGISGETEPLKALGINLSAANLEAFALSKGLDKAYASMSQAEQMALRYQYIMQATGDAQGDFARTADGYANSLRRLESSWETIKTVIGGFMLTVVEPLVSTFANFLSLLTTPPEKTVFDELNDIEVDYESEISEIQQTAEEARTLITVLESIHTNTAVSDEQQTLVGLLDALTAKIPGLKTALEGEDPSVKIKALATALSNNGQGISVEAWKTALENYASYAGQLTSAMQSSDPAGEIKKLAEQLAPGSGIDVSTWEGILTTFANTLASSNVSSNAESISGKIQSLSQTLSAKDGIPVSAWQTAFQYFGQYKNEFFTALSSNDPGTKLDDLAKKLSADYPTLSVETWKEILGKLSGYLTEADSGLDVSGIIAKISSVEGVFTGLSTAMSQKSGVDVSAWQTAFTNFGSYKDEFFSALSTNNPKAELDKLAEALSAKYEGMSVETWKSILGTLQSYLTTADSELSTEGIIEKLTGLTGAVTSASEAKLGNLLATMETDAGGATHTNIDAWTAVLGTFSGNVTGFNQAMGQYNGGSTTKIKNLAAALSGIDGDEAKVTAWKELVGLLVNNADEIGEIMGWSGEDTWEWVTNLLGAVNGLDPTKAESFDKLWNLLLNGANGQGLGQMGVPSNVVGSFNELTGAIDGTYYASAQEIEILKRLMTMYPQLSEIVNINTGEIKGGIQALKDYVDEAEATRIKLAMQKRLDAYQKIIDERYEHVAEWEVDLVINDSRLDKAMLKAANYRKMLESMGVQIGKDDDGEWMIKNGSDVNLATPVTGVEGAENLMDLVNLYYEAEDVVTAYSAAHDELAGKIATEKSEIDEVKATLEEEAEAFGMSTEAKDANAAATDGVVMAEEDAAKALSSLKGMIQDIVNYQENVRKSVLGTLSQTVDGFKAVDRSAKEYWATMSGNEMSANLVSQLRFLEDYARLMDEARAKGFSDDVIAAVADGSVESMQYLRGMANATADEVKTINDRWGEVTAKKNDLADKIAAQRLAVDKEYQAMIDKAVEAALAMDQSATAGAGATATMEAVVQAVAAGRANLQGEVDSIMALLAQIGQVGNYGVYGTSGGIIGTGGPLVGKAKGAGVYATPHALGLDYVPYDGYLAELHQGETILTADEAAIWRNFTGADSANTQQAFDYDMMAGMISGIPSGGNVYLDGQTVGKLISQGQGDSYRRLQRSGWRG